MQGYIYTSCPNCMELLRVNVDFPSIKKGFTIKQHTCEHCSCEMIVEDKNVYKNGKVIAIG